MLGWIWHAKNVLVIYQKFWELGWPPPPFGKNSQKIPFFLNESPPNGSQILSCRKLQSHLWRVYKGRMDVSERQTSNFELSNRCRHYSLHDIWALFWPTVRLFWGVTTSTFFALFLTQLVIWYLNVSIQIIPILYRFFLKSLSTNFFWVSRLPLP